MISGSALKMGTKTELHPRYLGRVSKRLQAMELNLLGSGSFAEVGKALDGEYRKLLCADTVSLLIRKRDGVDIFPEANDRGRVAGDNSCIHVVDARWIDQYPEHCRAGAWIGDFDEASHARYFPDTAESLQTVVLLPLSRRAKTIGILAFGSSDWHRQLAMVSVPGLNRLAAIVAVCVENLYSQELLRQVSLRDPLTGLFNRRYFSEHIERVLSQSLRAGQPMCCIYIDIDFFKSVNDEHGHAAGDLVLQSVAKKVVAQLRSGEVLARIGGEEFCIVLTDATVQVGGWVAERIRAAVAAKPICLPGGEQLSITVSCGTADSAPLTAFERSSAVENVLQRTDAALYQAKQRGRNQVVLDTTVRQG